MRIFAFLVLLLTLAGCRSTRPMAAAPVADDRKVLWWDATANFAELATDSAVAANVARAKQLGFGTIVVDIRPISGEVLYPSRIAPVMTEWRGLHRSADFDLPESAIRHAHAAGLKVYLSVNVFVAGHKQFRRGPVYTDHPEWQTTVYTADGLMPITQYAGGYSAMVNPLNRDFQGYMLSLLREIASRYPKLDGLILDRCRWDSIRADFSDTTRAAFEAFRGAKVANWPTDIFTYGRDTTALKAGENPENRGAMVVPGPLYREWLGWRPHVIQSYFQQARAAIKAINPRLTFGNYVGAWYDQYYDVGSNWAPQGYDPGFAWTSKAWADAGYAGSLDILFVGTYFKRFAADGPTDWLSIEGAMRQINGFMPKTLPVVASVYLEDYKGEPRRYVESIRVGRAHSAGIMVFDLVHIRNNGWWDETAEGLR